MTSVATSTVAFRQGDDQPYAALVQQHTSDLLRIAHCFVDDADEAEDLVQETWTLVYLRRQQFRGDGSLRGWIRRVCSRTCLDHVRKEARRRDLLRLAPTDALVSESDTSAGPEGSVDGLLPPVLHRAWTDLSERQRRVLLWRTYGDLTTNAIAKRLRIPEGTVKSDLWRSSRLLRQAFERSGNGTAEEQYVS